MELSKRKIELLEKEFGMTSISTLEKKFDNHIAEIKRQNKIMNGKSRKLYNVAQTSKTLGLSRLTVEKYMKDGHIKFIELDNRKYIPNSEINRLNFIEQ
jgi:hypothetical protein|tara:strand:- start:242 stop:538 length:297 start_codon:yes stop_codon:yes gene_type:complete